MKGLEVQGCRGGWLHVQEGERARKRRDLRVFEDIILKLVRSKSYPSSYKLRAFHVQYRVLPGGWV